VFEDEVQMLRQHGHDVATLYCSNSEATEASLWGKAKYFWYAPWSPIGYGRMAKAIEEFKPDVVHVHNFFLVFSPYVFKAAYDMQVPVVVTLHNYRMASPCSQLLRNNKICEKCVGKNPWRLLLYRCYKDSFLASFLRYRIYYLSRKRYGWGKYISVFIALTDFGRAKLIQSGLPKERVMVISNSVPEFSNKKNDRAGKGALFIGTLSRDKGVTQLVEAWKEIDYPLTIVGTGALLSELQRIAPSQVSFVGKQSREKVAEYLADCAFLVMPSIWYEGLPLVLLEAMAMRRAIVATGHGAMASVVDDGVTGLHFIPEDLNSLKEKINEMITRPLKTKELGENGYRKYLKLYHPEEHYQKLIEVYTKSINELKSI